MRKPHPPSNLTATYLGQSRFTVQTGMPHEHAALCLMCGPVAPHLEPELPGIRIRKRVRKTMVVVYADDITTLVRTQTDVPVINDTIQCYEKTTGARLNTRKSKALAVGGWSTSTDTLNITNHAEIKILGLTFVSIIEHSMNKSWANVTGKVRAQARETFERDLTLSQRIRYVQTHLLAKIWHTTRCCRHPRHVPDN